MRMSIRTRRVEERRLALTPVGVGGFPVGEVVAPLEADDRSRKKENRAAA
jgi:hypothetical protein